MTRRRTFALVAAAMMLSAQGIRAQGASIAVGAVMPVGDLSNVAGNGYDIDLQARTEPMIGPLALRIDIGLDHFAAKAGYSYHQSSVQSVSLIGDIGSMFYWYAGPGYYQMQDKTQIDGHNVTDERTYFGAQAGAGINVPVFRWEGFLEVTAIKFFTPAPSIVYLPLRFGVRL